tara:strand:+ start:2188 stop:2433 length:246 start_codon:yes stop_codon:yes gene_type:complete
MAIERRLNGMGESVEGNAAEIGLDAVLEIEIEEPEIAEMEDGSVEITLVSDTVNEDIENAPFDANLAEYMEEGQLLELSKN